MEINKNVYFYTLELKSNSWRSLISSRTCPSIDNSFCEAGDVKTHLPRDSAYILQISNNGCETLIALYAFSNQPYLKVFEEYNREAGNSFNEMREVRVKQAADSLALFMAFMETGSQSVDPRTRDAHVSLQSVRVKGAQPHMWPVGDFITEIALLSNTQSHLYCSNYSQVSSCIMGHSVTQKNLLSLVWLTFCKLFRRWSGSSILEKSEIICFLFSVPKCKDWRNGNTGRIL